MTAVLRTTANLAYRFGLGPRPSDTPDHRLVELVEGRQVLTPGRALDLGCATGRNALYLARHGWDATGVERSAPAVRMANRKASAAGLSARFVVGDVTKLTELGIGEGYRLLIDSGCYHLVPPSRRDAYAAGVTQVAAPGALLIMVGFNRPGYDLNEEELLRRFPTWQLLAVEPVPGAQLQEYVTGPPPVRALLGRDLFHNMRYQLVRIAS